MEEQQKHIHLPSGTPSFVCLPRGSDHNRNRNIETPLRAYGCKLSGYSAARVFPTGLIIRKSSPYIGQKYILLGHMDP